MCSQRLSPTSSLVRKPSLFVSAFWNRSAGPPSLRARHSLRSLASLDFPPGARDHHASASVSSDGGAYESVAAMLRSTIDAVHRRAPTEGGGSAEAGRAVGVGNAAIGV